MYRHGTLICVQILLVYSLHADTGGRIILKWIENKYAGRVGNQFIRLTIGLLLLLPPVLLLFLLLLLIFLKDCSLLWILALNTIFLPSFPTVSYHCLPGFRRVRKIAKKRILPPSVCPSVWGFSRNLIFVYFSKTCQENSSFIKIGQEHRVLYVKTFVQSSSYLAHLFLEWKMFQTKVAEKIRTNILFLTRFFRKSRRLWDNVEKYRSDGLATDNNMAQAYCMLNN